MPINDHPSLHYSRIQIRTNQMDNTIILDAFPQAVYQDVMIDSVKESRQVNIDNGVVTLLGEALGGSRSCAR